jgi:hypothetical protein
MSLKGLLAAVSRESHRYIRATSFAGFIVGQIFLVGLFWLLQDTWVLSRASGQANQLWLYFGWLIALSMTLNVCKELCDDISVGVIPVLLQAKGGISSVIRARFIVAFLNSAVSVLLVALSVKVFKNVAPVLEAEKLLALLIILGQCYAIGWMMVALTLGQRSLIGAQLVSIAVMLPWVVLPVRSLLGSASIYIPIAGPLEILAGFEAADVAIAANLLAVPVLLLLSRWVYSATMSRLRKHGTLLMV